MPDKSVIESDTFISNNDVSGQGQITNTENDVKPI